MKWKRAWEGNFEGKCYFTSKQFCRYKAKEESIAVLAKEKDDLAADVRVGHIFHIN
jgi:hypothetical protein